MKSSWLHKEDREMLIVFCNGWGMDDRPFHFLKSSQYDVFMLYDYRQFDDEGLESIKKIMDEYTTVHLVGWSMGVWAGQKLFFDCRSKFNRTIAINGTLCPIDDNYGIPEKIFRNTFENLSEESRVKFYKRMCRKKGNLKSFLANPPGRSVEDQREELGELLDQVDCFPAELTIYDEILIADKDLIVPTANQLKFWQGQKFAKLNGYHFSFNLFEDWDQLLLWSENAYCV